MQWETKQVVTVTLSNRELAAIKQGCLLAVSEIAGQVYRLEEKVLNGEGYPTDELILEDLRRKLNDADKALGVVIRLGLRFERAQEEWNNEVCDNNTSN